jgi:HSP20 family protein
MRLVPYGREIERPIEMFNMMDEFFNSSLNNQESKKGFKIDVLENDHAFVIEGELPGIDRENINIDFENNLLKIVVEQKADESVEKNYVHKERKQYSMERVVRFKNVNHEAIEAKLEKGILTVTIPKQEIVDNKKKIEIQ